MDCRHTLFEVRKKLTEAMQQLEWSLNLERRATKEHLMHTHDHINEQQKDLLDRVMAGKENIPRMEGSIKLKEESISNLEREASKQKEITEKTIKMLQEIEALDTSTKEDEHDPKTSYNEAPRFCRIMAQDLSWNLP
ncbi:hypothetical protein GOP47_0008099 [Adiantum capillus-veneris]|uniref:Uncharacterized protein n=1 Tax=Adiantum capillus-veneris TaxID=13818 RepID=A0A9D4UY33_ADICA|nr:hypothetical protein GOP47_0008099 [Adiantum capillus-veneris]